MSCRESQPNFFANLAWFSHIRWHSLTSWPFFSHLPSSGWHLWILFIFLHENYGDWDSQSGNCGIPAGKICTIPAGTPQFPVPVVLWGKNFHCTLPTLSCQHNLWRPLRQNNLIFQIISTTKHSSLLYSVKERFRFFSKKVLYFGKISNCLHTYGR